MAGVVRRCEARSRLVASSSPPRLIPGNQPRTMWDCMNEVGDVDTDSHDGHGDAVGYPPYVLTAQEEHRWDLCEQMSEALFADLDPGQRREQVWSATRALYSSDIPT